MNHTARPATTILLLRPAPSGFSVFVVQRHSRSAFLPSAWVFPGGRVEPSDALPHPAVRGGEVPLAQLGLPEPEGRAHLVAGVRETFEESGIWLGEGQLPPASRDPLARGELQLGALLDAHRSTLDLGRLRAWSWWITPVVEPRRYDTRFLVAVAPGAEGAHDQRETVDSGWFTPAELLAGADAGRFPMAPPTWWTLRELAAFATAEAAFESALTRPQRPIQPILSLADGGLELSLPGHPAHPEPEIPGLPPTVRMTRGRWWAG